MNLRRLMSKSAFVRWLLDPTGDVRRAAELYEADTRLLERLRERDAAPAPIVCADLPTLWARPGADPDYANHQWPSANTTDAVVWWLTFAWPDAWYFEDGLTLANLADRLLETRRRCAAGTLSEVTP